VTSGHQSGEDLTLAYLALGGAQHLWFLPDNDLSVLAELLRCAFISFPN
jgi:hypothetical protein